ncbi:MAG TPA: hypothetical protein VFM59_03335 [Salinimicrobium sp.]|nr:hypothetical protein [Salinimicrobium sp.]
MKTNLLRSLSFGIFMLLVACGENTDVVESGTYEGTIDKVEADKNEIYVSTADDKTLELYFTDETELTQNGSPVEFSALEVGQNVRVQVEKVGKRLDPISVEILD